MANRGYNFSAVDVRRISDTVKAYEGETTSTTGKPSGIKPQSFGRDLHVKIGQPRGPGKYDAILLTPSEADEISPDDPAKQDDVGAEHVPDDGITVIAINTAEIEKGTNEVEADTIWPCSIIRRPTPASPILFVSFSPGGSLPTGQYQGMILQMVNDNKLGFDFLISHAMEG